MDQEMSRLVRACLLGLALACVGALAVRPAAAKTVPGSPPFRVLVMDHVSESVFRELASRGAVGLLVPGVGPTTNRRQALAELERGAEVNARLGGVPSGPRLLTTSHATGIPTGHGVVVVALPPPGKPGTNDRRYRIAVVGRGFHGLLSSKTTRIPGLVSIVDIAPTALGHARGALTSAASARPLADLASLDAQIHANNRLKFPALFIVAGALALLALLGLRAATTAVPAALLVNVGLGVAQVSNEVAIVGVLAAGTVLGALWLSRVCRGDGGLLVLYLGVVVLHVLLFATRPEWVAITPLGPTQNQRFWGVGNQLETLLLVPLLAGPLLARRRLGAPGFAAFALIGLVVMADNRLGADGGGAIVLGVALAFLGARLLRLRVTGFLTLLLLAATLVLAVVSTNLREPGPNHLRSAFAHGLRGLVAVAENRVPLSYQPAFAQWSLVLPLGIVFAVALAVALRTARRQPRHDLLLALGVAVATSLVVNDSAAYVLACGIAAVGAFARFTPSYERVGVTARARAALEAQPVRSRD
jgi:preprotein translocase subunit SecG